MGLAADLTAQRWSALAFKEAGWREPAAVAAAFADEPHVLLLLSDGSETGRWSYLMRRPEHVLVAWSGESAQALADAAALLGPTRHSAEGAPPFQGGLAGLASYEFGLAFEPSVGDRRDPFWPDLAAGLYPHLLAFDHATRRVLALGRGADSAEAEARAEAALAWLGAPAAAPLPNRIAERFEPIGSAAAYEDGVADVVARIAAGEIFQANIARRWGGRLAEGARPIDLLARLAGESPAPFAAYFRLPCLAVVSNSPERFLKVEAGGAVETRPIKGTRPRGSTPAEDAALGAELQVSAKDRAENLMIVDLMRNDLARVCTPGSVEVPELWRLESFANVHHLVSTVTGRLASGLGAFDLMAASFPPGSITGAPKVQAMRVIAGHETPRGPYCGSIFWAGFDGAFDSSVLIRTVALVEDQKGWRFEARAGAGIVADSDPAMECAETEAKIGAIARAFGSAP